MAAKVKRGGKAKAGAAGHGASSSGSSKGPQTSKGTKKATTGGGRHSSKHAGKTTSHGTKTAPKKKASRGSSHAGRHSARPVGAARITGRIMIIAAIACIVVLAVSRVLVSESSAGSFAGSALPSSSVAYTNPFDWSNLSFGLDGRPRYVVDGVTESRVGIDVSEHQGDIDWGSVRADGIGFAFVRVGYRGSSNGTIVEDAKFEQNLAGAQAAGVELGAYFYSQATTEAEAVEEARYVLQKLQGVSLSYPVAFDYEPTGNQGSRIYALSKDQMRAVADAFCQTIEASGRTAIVYGNQSDLARMDAASLYTYGYWYASYTSAPTLDMAFAIWQYASTGQVAGISTSVDMDLDLSRPLAEGLAATSSS